MPNVDINGTTVAFPDELTADQLNKAVARAAGQLTAASKPPDTRGMVEKGWDALAVPEKMSRQGLQQLAGMVPNPEPKGNLPLDVIKGTPKIVADTLAEAAPGFVSRGAILTAGAGKTLQLASEVPAISSAAGSVAGQGENLGGIQKGALKEIFKDPKVLFSKAKEAASDLYKTTRAKYTDRLLELNTDNPQKIIDAGKVLAESGQMNPAEAQTVLQQLPRPTTNVDFAFRKPFEAIKNSDPDFVKADTLHALGRKLESVQKLFPQNKTGGVSVFKLGEMMAAAKYGGPVGVAVGSQFSPLVQGLEAAGTGALAANPVAGGGIVALLQALSRRKSQ